MTMDTSESARVVTDWLDHNQLRFVEMADHIWRTPELAWKEFEASHLQAS